MKYTDYKYYVVCMEQKNERWNKVKTIVDPNIYTMRTMYLYDENAVKHIEANGSLRGYHGKKRASELIIDFDNHGILKESDYIELRQSLFDFLINDFDYDVEIWGTYVKPNSRIRKIDEGKPSGLHLRIPFSYEIEPCVDMHHKLKYIAYNLFKKEYIDKHIYSEHRMIRVEDSKRDDDFGKFLLGVIENRNRLTPSLLTGYTEPAVPNITVETEQHKWPQNPLIKRCIYGSKIRKGQRHHKIGYCCKLLKDYGFSREQASPILLSMLANCEYENESDNPLYNDSLNTLLNQNFYG